MYINKMNVKQHSSEVQKINFLSVQKTNMVARGKMGKMGGWEWEIQVSSYVMSKT